MPGNEGGGGPGVSRERGGYGKPHKEPAEVAPPENRLLRSESAEDLGALTGRLGPGGRTGEVSPEQVERGRRARRYRDPVDGPHGGGEQPGSEGLGEQPGSEGRGERPRRNGEPGGEAGGGGYRPAEEALRAGEVAAEVLREAHEGVNDLRREHWAEVDQTPGLAEAIDRLTAAVDALSRTVAALIEELKAGRGGGSLAAVAVMQKPVADGAAEEAVSAAASDGAVQRALRVILGKLKRAGEWLWSMIIHLVTIREWSVGGEVGLPGFGKARLTVTFGG
jgi:hypothetical protein